MLPNVCVLGTLSGVERDWELREGLTRTKSFPETATFEMNPEFPDNTLLADNLRNTASAIVASNGLKRYLESQAGPKVEYLPVTILDHRGKVASRDHFIVHPIDPVDCLDLKKCQPTWNRIQKTWINRVRHLVLQEDKVPADRFLFRPKAFHRVILVRRELAEAIERKGFTGVRWLELDEFPE